MKKVRSTHLSLIWGNGMGLKTMIKKLTSYVANRFDIPSGAIQKTEVARLDSKRSVLDIGLGLVIAIGIMQGPSALARISDPSLITNLLEALKNNQGANISNGKKDSSGNFGLIDGFINAAKRTQSLESQIEEIKQKISENEDLERTGDSGLIQQSAHLSRAELLKIEKKSKKDLKLEAKQEIAALKRSLEDLKRGLIQAVREQDKASKALLVKGSDKDLISMTKRIENQGGDSDSDYNHNRGNNKRSRRDSEEDDDDADHEHTGKRGKQDSSRAKTSVSDLNAQAKEIQAEMEHLKDEHECESEDEGQSEHCENVAKVKEFVKLWNAVHVKHAKNLSDHSEMHQALSDCANAAENLLSNTSERSGVHTANRERFDESCGLVQDILDGKRLRNSRSPSSSSSRASRASSSSSLKQFSDGGRSARGKGSRGDREACMELLTVGGAVPSGATALMADTDDALLTYLRNKQKNNTLDASDTMALAALEKQHSQVLNEESEEENEVHNDKAIGKPQTRKLAHEVHGNDGEGESSSGQTSESAAAAESNLPDRSHKLMFVGYDENGHHLVLGANGKPYSLTEEQFFEEVGLRQDEVNDPVLFADPDKNSRKVRVQFHGKDGALKQDDLSFEDAMKKYYNSYGGGYTVPTDSALSVEDQLGVLYTALSKKGTITAKHQTKLQYLTNYMNRTKNNNDNTLKVLKVFKSPAKVEIQRPYGEREEMSHDDFILMVALEQKRAKNIPGYGSKPIVTFGSTGVGHPNNNTQISDAASAFAKLAENTDSAELAAVFLKEYSLNNKAWPRELLDALGNTPEVKKHSSGFNSAFGQYKKMAEDFIGKSINTGAIVPTEAEALGVALQELAKDPKTSRLLGVEFGRIDSDDHGWHKLGSISGYPVGNGKVIVQVGPSGKHFELSTKEYENLQALHPNNPALANAKEGEKNLSVLKGELENISAPTWINVANLIEEDPRFGYNAQKLLANMKGNPHWGLVGDDSQKEAQAAAKIIDMAKNMPVDQFKSVIKSILEPKAKAVVVQTVNLNNAVTLPFDAAGKHVLQVTPLHGSNPPQYAVIFHRPNALGTGTDVENFGSLSQYQAALLADRKKLNELGLDGGAVVDIKKDSSVASPASAITIHYQNGTKVKLESKDASSPYVVSEKSLDFSAQSGKGPLMDKNDGLVASFSKAAAGVNKATFEVKIRDNAGTIHPLPSEKPLEMYEDILEKAIKQINREGGKLDELSYVSPNIIFHSHTRKGEIVSIDTTNGEISSVTAKLDGAGMPHGQANAVVATRTVGGANDGKYDLVFTAHGGGSFTNLKDVPEPAMRKIIAHITSDPFSVHDLKVNGNVVEVVGKSGDVSKIGPDGTMIERKIATTGGGAHNLEDAFIATPESSGNYNIAVKETKGATPKTIRSVSLNNLRKIAAHIDGELGAIHSMKVDPPNSNYIVVEGQPGDFLKINTANGEVETRSISTRNVGTHQIANAFVATRQPTDGKYAIKLLHTADGASHSSYPATSADAVKNIAGFIDNHLASIHSLSGDGTHIKVELKKGEVYKIDPATGLVIERTLDVSHLGGPRDAIEAKVTSSVPYVYEIEKNGQKISNLSDSDLDKIMNSVKSEGNGNIASVTVNASREIEVAGTKKGQVLKISSQGDIVARVFREYGKDAIAAKPDGVHGGYFLEVTSRVGSKDSSIVGVADPKALLDKVSEFGQKINDVKVEPNNHHPGHVMLYSEDRKGEVQIIDSTGKVAVRLLHESLNGVWEKNPLIEATPAGPNTYKIKVKGGIQEVEITSDKLEEIFDALAKNGPKDLRNSVSLVQNAGKFRLEYAIGGAVVRQGIDLQ